jgi:hypothetical protein
MTNFYGQCKDGLIAKLRTLTSYFPAGTGKAAGWQVSSSDLVISEGGEYFAIVRPGAFPSRRVSGKLKDVEWHCTVLLHYRFSKAETVWNEYELFRSDIFNVINADPTLGGTPNVWDVVMDSSEEPGYLADSEGNTQNVIVQTCDVAITQRIPHATALPA